MPLEVPKSCALKRRARVKKNEKNSVKRIRFARRTGRKCLSSRCLTRARDTVIRIFFFFFFFFYPALVDSSRAKIKRKKGGTRGEGKKKRVSPLSPSPPPLLRDCVRRCEKKRVTRCSFSFVTLSSSSRDNRIEPAEDERNGLRLLRWRCERSVGVGMSVANR